MADENYEDDIFDDLSVFPARLSFARVMRHLLTVHQLR